MRKFFFTRIGTMASIDPPDFDPWSKFDIDLGDIEIKPLTFETAHEDMKTRRKRFGLCPECGAKGAFVNMVMVCDEHGPY